MSARLVTPTDGLYEPRGYELNVTEHFIPSALRVGSSKRTGIVTARLTPKHVRSTEVDEIDVDLTVTGTDERVARIVRAVIQEMTA